MKLLVVAPNTLHGDDLKIVENAIAHVESYSGRWRTIDIEPARGSLIAMSQERNSDHVLLLGSQLSALLPPPRDANLDAVHRFGILRHRGHQRWISSPHPRAYTPPPDDTKRKSPVVAANLIGHLVRQLELLHWGHVGWTDPTEPVRTRVVHDEKSLDAFVREIRSAREVAIDTETKSLQRIGGQLLTVQMGTDGHSAWVLPVAHPGSPLHPHLLRRAREFLRWYFEHARRAVHVYANAVFDLHQLFDWLHLRWYNHHIWDVQYGEFSLDENRESRKSLGFCFHPDTLVETTEGSIPIRELVHSLLLRSSLPKVYSYNHITKSVEPKNIIASCEHATQKEMVEIEYEGGQIRVTADHPIWSVTRDAYVPAGDLLPDEEIAAPDEHLAGSFRRDP